MVLSDGGDDDNNDDDNDDDSDDVAGCGGGGGGSGGVALAAAGCDVVVRMTATALAETDGVVGSTFSDGFRAGIMLTVLLDWILWTASCVVGLFIATVRRGFDVVGVVGVGVDVDVDGGADAFRAFVVVLSVFVHSLDNCTVDTLLMSLASAELSDFVGVVGLLPPLVDRDFVTVMPR